MNPTPDATQDTDKSAQDPAALERELGEVKGQLQDTATELEQSRQMISRLERRQKIDELLADSDTVDVELARLLTEAAVEMMDEPDLKLAIDDLRQSKPYLFRHRAPDRAMSARSPDPRHTHADNAARRAVETGKRRDLLSYLRLRRHS
ncbi:MAG: hypothetical protein K8S99_06545 [Planctomycetes bacterium]|nr:hypothetical protein [Planctomycetota bacterium]